MLSHILDLSTFLFQLWPGFRFLFFFLNVALHCVQCSSVNSFANNNELREQDFLSLIYNEEQFHLICVSRITVRHSYVISKRVLSTKKFGTFQTEH